MKSKKCPINFKGLKLIYEKILKLEEEGVKVIDRTFRESKCASGERAASIQKSYVEARRKSSRK